MAETSKIYNDVTGAALVVVLQDDIRDRIDEMLPHMVQRIEDTHGWVSQSCMVSVKFRPGDDEAGKPSVFAIEAKLSGATMATVRTLSLASQSEGPRQLTMFTRDDS